MSTVVFKVERSLDRVQIRLTVVRHAEGGAAVVGQRRLSHRHTLARQHALVDDHVAVEQHGVALHDGHVLDGDEIARYEVLARYVLFVEARLAGGVAAEDCLTGGGVDDVAEGALVHADRVERVGDGDDGEEDDAAGVVVVVVVEPEGAGEHLEDVEGREDLAEKHDKERREVDADGVFAVEVSSGQIELG